MLLVSASHFGVQQHSAMKLRDLHLTRTIPIVHNPCVQHFLILLKRQKTSATTIPAIVVPCCHILYLGPGILLDISLELQL